MLINNMNTHSKEQNNFLDAEPLVQNANFLNNL